MQLHITLHLCYVGGQITPHQLCTTIGYGSGRRISNRYWFSPSGFVTLLSIGAGLVGFKVRHKHKCRTLAVIIFDLSMVHSGKKTLYSKELYRLLSILLTVVTFMSCNAQSSKETIKTVDTTPKVAPESLHFVAHIIENNEDGSKSEIDTITGYRKYYYANGKLQMEGKVTKASPKDYRDGIWNYYNEAGQLMKQETSNQQGKINELDFMYFTNGKPLSKTYQYFEGDYKDKATFKFHKIETLFYTNGQELAQRHWVNNNLVEEKCWDSKGNPKPIEYLKTVKSVQADE